MSTREEAFTLHLPDHWTPAQALAVYALLDALAEAVADRYALALPEELRRDDDHPAQPDLFDFDDPIPF